MLCCVSYATNGENTNKCEGKKERISIEKSISSASDKVLVSLRSFSLKQARAAVQYRHPGDYLSVKALKILTIFQSLSSIQRCEGEI